MVVGADHPLLGTLDPKPRVAVRHGLEAEFARPVYYELAEIALAEGDEPPGVWSDGAFFPLGPAMTLSDRLRERSQSTRRRAAAPATWSSGHDGEPPLPRCWSRSPIGPSPA